MSKTENVCLVKSFTQQKRLPIPCRARYANYAHSTCKPNSCVCLDSSSGISFVDTNYFTRIISILKFSIVIGSPAPIYHVIGPRSRGCSVTGIQFKLFVSGYLQLCSHLIISSITRALTGPFVMSPTFFKT